MGDTLYYTIHEVAERLVVPIQKLRRWDQQGVLKAQRSPGGHRRYSRELIDRIVATTLSAEKTSQDIVAIKKTLGDKRRIAQLLLESEHRYRDLVETSHDVVCITDAEGRFTYLNHAAEEMFGMSLQALVGRCFFDFEAGNAHLANRRFLATLKRQREVRNYVTHLLTPQGDDRWIGINARVLCDDAGNAIGMRGTARDITEQQLALQRIEYLALHDSETDLPNRLALERCVDNAIGGDAPGALLFLDLDHFKSASDSRSQPASEELIKGMTSALRGAALEMHGELFRTGFDRFAIHLPRALRKEAAKAAERAVQAIQHYRLQTGSAKRPSTPLASIGIALYPFHGSDHVALFASAEKAMHRARELGRNRHVIFDKGSENVRSTHKRVTWSKKLRDALDDDRLILFAQPVIRLADRQTVNHEVLVRMRDEDGRIILPEQFIDLAETLGVVPEIDMRVVEKLLSHMQQQGLMGKKLRYFVNLSRVSIADKKWTKRFLEMVSVSKAAPGQLVFEMKEAAAMSDIDATLSFLRQVKEMGCRFALDDYGSGFSSFYYLKRLSVDYLKIGDSLIRNLKEDEGNRIFVKALNDVAQSMRRQVIAESVESADILQVLLGTGAQFAQGFFFQQPVPLGFAPPPEAARQAMIA